MGAGSNTTTGTGGSGTINIRGGSRRSVVIGINGAKEGFMYRPSQIMPDNCKMTTKEANKEKVRKREQTLMITTLDVFSCKWMGGVLQTGVI